jgi:N-acetylglutamate synthase-like GNAT family acetyltransferase
MLAAVLPSMTTANLKLLASGTYYVQQTPDGRIVSCGGWTPEEPGTNRVEDGVAHLRHFATHVDFIKQGLGAGILDRCRQDALAAGVGTLMCFSSLSAVAFYTSFGFSVHNYTDLIMRSGAKFPTVIMEWRAAPDHAPRR